RGRAAPAGVAGRRAWPGAPPGGTPGAILVRPVRRPGPGGRDEPADPDPAHEAVHLELARRLRAVAREVAQDQVDVFAEPEPVIHVGDRRGLLGIELLRGAQHAEPAAVRDRERARDLEVVRFLRGREVFEADAGAGAPRVLAAPERRLRLHRPGLRAGDPDRDDQDAEV